MISADDLDLLATRARQDLDPATGIYGYSHSLRVGGNLPLYVQARAMLRRTPAWSGRSTAVQFFLSHAACPSAGRRVSRDYLLRKFGAHCPD